MLDGGAYGDSARQIVDSLHFRPPRESLHEAFNALDLHLPSSAGNGPSAGIDTGKGYRISIANALWTQSGSALLQEYRNIAGSNNGAGIHQVDFAGNAEGSRQRINDWVSEQTDGKIQDLLPKGAIHKRRAPVLTNAIAFDAMWQSLFETSETRSRPFRLLDGSAIATPTMTNESIEVGYAAKEGYQVIELPHKGGLASTVIFLPDAGRFEWFERRLDAQLAADAIGSLVRKTVDLYMPRLEFTGP